MNLRRAERRITGLYFALTIIGVIALAAAAVAQLDIIINGGRI